MGIAAYHKDALMDHFRNPRNRGGLERAQATGRGANPLCGDEVEVGLRLEGGRLAEVVFRARACAICTASASLLTVVLEGREIPEAGELRRTLESWLDGGDGAPPAPLDVLEPVRGEGARRRCVLLPWEALEEGLREASRKA
ncbi:iron-sulfur cluster assembly scaffold protein [Thiohalorhabdus methylotrophus]|uniref:Iron-sulfur cluster assembly scaffold protein n=1 Tax=Thiohalorhabdus methylotrophus TaxID=3242694 RepID=A0ABV4TRI2_9GAMM